MSVTTEAAAAATLMSMASIANTITEGQVQGGVKHVADCLRAAALLTRGRIGVDVAVAKGAGLATAA